ncbi:hypothetical protein C1J03_19205 [Sulfitobacter sp. SK012]|uniref:hypothetical protein n=1 Tax=Sulfitobacter sp. SK012 TaxID=1389005 RepID=UPI000E0B853D|nr:hypothetical protein [Sulfitobacter sp. SK012]AXI47944.1 hypothetical protein C1J03_19205 [Sulfitobacter sp. SK012]
MPFVTVSHWTATEVTDEMIAKADAKFVPLIKANGATGVQMVRTGDLSICVITQYADAATAQSAQAKIAGLREQVAKEFPMTMTSAHGGDVVGGS